MCGIVGYVGQKQALEILVAGLRRLEYRGYDSAGMAVLSDGALEVRKKAGKLAILETLLGSDPMPDSTTGIGHTRWATHGGPTDRNAHPHVSEDRRIAVIHNGIIENFAELRDELTAAGILFASETDTEVVAHLLAAELPVADDDLAEAMRRVCRRLEGAFTLLAIDRTQPDVIVGARRNSPLVVGIGDGENFLASDVAAFVDHTREALELGQDQVVTHHRRRRSIVTDFDGGARRGASPSRSTGTRPPPRRAATTCSCSRRSPSSPRPSPTRFAAGSARTPGSSSTRRTSTRAYCARSTRSSSSRAAPPPTRAWSPSTRSSTGRGCPSRSSSPASSATATRSSDRTRLVIAISQSGETMDTLMALRHAKAQGARTLAICNTVGSTIPREADAALYTLRGPGDRRGVDQGLPHPDHRGLPRRPLPRPGARDDVRGRDPVDARRLDDMPSKVDLVLDTTEPVRALARELADAPSVLFLGRHVGFPVALEGALKLKELAYMHAEGFAAAS